MARPPFRPTDADLLERYLRPKRDGQPLPADSPFIDTDIYEYHPQQLADSYAPTNGAHYFFTIVTRQRMKNGLVHVVSRHVPNGLGKWKISGLGEKIRNRRGDIVGSRRELRFEPRDDEGWVLEEFFMHLQDDDQPRTWHELAAYRLYPHAIRGAFRGPYELIIY